MMYTASFRISDHDKYNMCATAYTKQMKHIGNL